MSGRGSARAMRPSTWFLLTLAAGLGGLAGMVVHAHSCGRAARLLGTTALVARYGLTDLCLFTEARYTRHPAMADLHAPFQDHPMALEHFPSGGLLAPPAHILGSHARPAPQAPQHP